LTDVLSACSLSFSYPGSEPLFEDLSFSLQAGEALGIIGPSGCGKSTLALMLCGIIPHCVDGRVGGSVSILGKNLCELTLPQIATRIGIVFQDPETQLFLPQIESELAFGPENLCLPKEEIEKVISEVAELTTIEPLLSQHPNEISGGQQQLAALSAVLCLDPALLILDEVTSQLDQDSGERILAVIKQLTGKGKTVVMIDHNFERLHFVDRVLMMGAEGQHYIGKSRDVLNNKDLLLNCFGDSTGEIILDEFLDC